MSEYVRVPRAPTVEMIAATVDAVFGGAIEDASIIAEVYSAMVEAATAGQEPTDAGRDYADMRRMQAALIAKTHECNELRALAAEQPQPEAPSGWIACNERMPEAGSEVLVWLAAPAFRGDSRIAMDTWGEQHEAPVSWSSATIPVGMGWDSGTDWECITHWMPLPAAPGAAQPPAALAARGK